MAGKLNIANLKEEEKEKLRQYVDSLKEIKKEISKLVNKGKALITKGKATAKRIEKKLRK